MQVKQDKSYSYWRKHLYKKIQIEKLRGRTILDIGCGTGEDAFYLSKIARKVYAFDIEKADIWRKFLSSKLIFSVADAYNIPFKDSTFDGIFLKDVLHHVDHPEKILEEIKRVARKGALIFIVEANRYNPIFFIHMTKMRGHEHLSQGKFRGLIKNYFHTVSFQQFESHYLPFLSFPLYLLIENSIEKMFEKLPLLNRFQSYNLAIIEK